MKLIIAIVHKDDSHAVVDSLKSASFKVTKMESEGGFLSQKNTTILVGTEEKGLKKALGLIKENSKSRTEYISAAPQAGEPGDLIPQDSVEIKVGGATVFVIDADFKQF